MKRIIMHVKLFFLLKNFEVQLYLVKHNLITWDRNEARFFFSKKGWPKRLQGGRREILWGGNQEKIVLRMRDVGAWESEFRILPWFSFMKDVAIPDRLPEGVKDAA